GQLSMRRSPPLQAVNQSARRHRRMDAVSASAVIAGRPRLRLDWRVTPFRLAGALTLLALLLRLTDLGSRPLWLDEAFSAWFSDRSFYYLWHVLPTYEAHPPFFYSVLKVWRSLVRQLQAGEAGSWPSWLLFGASMALTCWSHALGILYGLCLALALLPVWLGASLSRARMVRGIATGALVAAIYLPCLVMMTSRA